MDPVTGVIARPAPQILPIFWVALAGALVMWLPVVTDPLIRFDDYPALFAEPALYWSKTLEEGRWLNYLWHLRGIETPAWLNFAVYQMLWAFFAAALAVAVTGNESPRFFTAAAALLIVVCPPATIMAPWFNTLLPGMALLALYAGLACRVSDRVLLGLLPPFVALSFMTYTTFPLVLLAVCLVAQRRKSLRNLLAVQSVFILSFVMSVLIVYAINWQVHGIFGVPLASWREATPATDLDGLIANLPKLWEAWLFLQDRIGFFYPPMKIAFALTLVAAVAVLVRFRPIEALYYASGLVIGLGLCVAQVLKLGVLVPPRAFVFLWIFGAIAATRAALLVSAARPERTKTIRQIAKFLVVTSVLLTIVLTYNYRGWQTQTRQIAAVVAPLPQPVFIRGAPEDMAAAQDAGIQSGLALAFRLRQLTGHKVVLCTRDPTDCEGLARPVRQSVIAEADIGVLAGGRGTVITVTSATPLAGSD